MIPNLQAQGDRDLSERLLKEPEIRQAIEIFEKSAPDGAARRHLLGTAMRLSPEMAPDIHDIMEMCRGKLGIALPVETYVFPSPLFNAAAVRPERGLLMVMVSSSLLEAFDPDELRFVVGHELGHHLFGHHAIPVGAMLGGGAPVSAALALQLFAWQRYAEISSDRAGLVCAEGLEPAARALFKLASGLKGNRIRILIDKFVSQIQELRVEAERQSRADEPLRSDWFATHPFSPLRVRAVELASQSELITSGGLKRDELESRVQQLMALMDPSYLSEKSSAAEAMRRLLFAGAVLIATSTGEPNEAVIKALETLLGPGSIPPNINPTAIREDLPQRIAFVNQAVPLLRRSQVIRDLCVIARADHHLDAREIKLISEIAAAVSVEQSIVNSHTSGNVSCPGES